jgi:hypothetical protein
MKNIFLYKYICPSVMCVQDSTEKRNIVYQCGKIAYPRTPWLIKKKIAWWCCKLYNTCNVLNLARELTWHRTWVINKVS